MQPQVAPPGQALRLDARSLIAAGLCVLALYFDVLGWVFAIAGIALLRRTAFSRTAKVLLAAMAIGPKILFVASRAMNAPAGLTFPIEPQNLASSPSLWTWSVLLAALGVFLMLMAPRGRRAIFVGVGLAPLAGAAVSLLGLIDGFHRIDDAGAGRWALRHAALGNVAVFRGRDVASIEASERRNSRTGRSYPVRVTLADGRSFSVTTKTAAALDELKKFATTANLPPGKARIGGWMNGASGFALEDCVGVYEPADAGDGPRSTFEFRMDGERLAGTEIVAGPGGRHVRALRNLKVSDSGAVEFAPDNYFGASRQKDGNIAVSFGWSSTSALSSNGTTARFVKNGFEDGPTKYRKR